MSFFEKYDQIDIILTSAGVINGNDKRLKVFYLNIETLKQISDPTAP